MQSSPASSTQQGSIEQQMEELWGKAHASHAAGDYPGAEALLQRLLHLQQRVFGAEDIRTLNSMTMQGLALDCMHRYGEAEALCREVLQIKQQSPQYGMEHPETLSSVTLLGKCLMHQRRYKDAEPMLRKVHATNVRVMGPGDGLTLRHQITLGECLMHDNQLEEAEQLLRDAWEGLKPLEGGQPELVAVAMHDLATCLTMAGKHAEAETILRAAVKLCRHRIGEHDEYTTLKCILSHAGVLARLDKHLAAEVMYKLGVQVSRAVHGWSHRRTLIACEEWAGCLMHQNKVEAAEGLMRETLTHVKQDLGEADPATLHWMGALAQILMMQGPSHPEKRNEAVVLLRKAAELREALPRQRSG